MSAYSCAMRFPVFSDSLRFALRSIATAGFLAILLSDLNRKRIRTDWRAVASCILPVLVLWIPVLSSSLAVLAMIMTIMAFAASWIHAGEIKPLTYLDLFSPAATVALCISTDIVSLLGSEAGLGWLQLVGYLLIGIYLWMEGRKAHQWQRPEGMVFGEFLVLNAVLIVSLRLGAPSAYPHDFTLPVAILLFMSGSLTVLLTLRSYTQTTEQRRILDRMELAGAATQPEYASASPECPHPHRWTMYDPMSVEVEVLEFLEGIVSLVKPRLIVETGTFAGLSAIRMAHGLRKNGFGKLISVELDPQVFAKAKSRIEASGLTEWIELRNESSLDAEIDGEIDLLFCDSKSEIREEEVRRFLPQVSPYGVVLIHDAASNLKVVREAVQRMEAEGLISSVFLPTPRGLAITQKSSRRERSSSLTSTQPELFTSLLTLSMLKGKGNRSVRSGGSSTA